MNKKHITVILNKKIFYTKKLYVYTTNVLFNYDSYENLFNY